MKFYISSAFLSTGEIVEVAKAADDLGYDGIGIPDHVVTMPWMFYAGPNATLAEKVDGMRRFRKDLALDR